MDQIFKIFEWALNLARSILGKVLRQNEMFIEMLRKEAELVSQFLFVFESRILDGRNLLALREEIQKWMLDQDAGSIEGDIRACFQNIFHLMSADSSYFDIRSQVANVLEYELRFLEYRLERIRLAIYGKRINTRYLEMLKKEINRLNQAEDYYTKSVGPTQRSGQEIRMEIAHAARFGRDEI